jgi:hypothetical protein
MNWQETDKRRKRHIRYAEKLFGGMFAEQRRVLKEQLKAAQSPQEVQMLAGRVQLDRERMVDFYRKVYIRTGMDFAKEEFRRFGKKAYDINKEIRETIWFEQLVKYVQDKTGVRITLVMQSAFKDIIRIAQKAVDQGISEGWGAQQVANYMMRELADIQLYQAMRIARTETMTATNYGKMRGMEQAANELGITIRKVWRATPDTRTRDDHFEMDGVSVAMNEKFEMPDGVTFLDYPGDPAGPPEQIINCRCTFMEEVVE